MNKLFIVMMVAATLTGCASLEEYKPLGEESAHPTTKKSKKRIAKTKPKGIYHKVQKGQTLWRIAKTYDVAIDELVSVNNIPNAALIEEGQLLLIPGAGFALSIEVPRQPTVTVATTTQEEYDGFLWPIRGKVISYFNDQNKNYTNRGIDIAASEGEQVKASRSGQVVFADYLNGYAQTVIIDHKDGFHSVYSQNSTLLVKLNDQVRQGQVVARVGKIGRKAHLHFEIRHQQKASNPLYYLP